MTVEDVWRAVMQIGKWKGERLGGGGQATTYLVHLDEEPNVPWVLKHLKPWEPGDKQANPKEKRSRFITEVTALRDLAFAKCPGIMPVIDAEIELDSPDEPWYVMPYFPLGSLFKSAVKGQ